MADAYLAALQEQDLDRAATYWQPVAGPRLYDGPIRLRLESAGPIRGFRYQRPLSVSRNFNFASLDLADSTATCALLYEVEHTNLAEPGAR